MYKPCYTHTGVLTCTCQVRVEMHRILKDSERLPTPPTLSPVWVHPLCCQSKCSLLLLLQIYMLRLMRSVCLLFLKIGRTLH